MTIPRILIAGLRGGGGKTLTSLAVTAAWRKRGWNVAPFKKGPDYIDAAWLSMAAGRPCRNLDLFLMSPATIVRSFATWASAGTVPIFGTGTVGHRREALVGTVGHKNGTVPFCVPDVALIEGNRGLYDGMDARGTCSTAELAKLLHCPVVLTVDCVKSTRTVAACVLGCQRADPEVSIQGVILNQTAGPRHESVLRDAIAEMCGLPVLGAVPRLADEIFPERHLGLVPPQEHDHVARAIERVAELGEQYLDLQALERIAHQAPAVTGVGDWGLGIGDQCQLANSNPQSPIAHPSSLIPRPSEAARIGVFRDAAFQFYYPENLEALIREGARLVEISPMTDRELPEVDALYLGGGFPETSAPVLAENQSFLRSLRQLIERGLPVYAECGGAVYLGRTLTFHDHRYPMAGVLPVDFAFGLKPQGHGYAVLKTVESNPFYPVGEPLRGHEFHYTYIQPAQAEGLTFAFRVVRGHGFDGQHDGLCHRNVLASYMHVHALGIGSWAPSLVRAAVEFRSTSATEGCPADTAIPVCAQGDRHIFRPSGVCKEDDEPGRKMSQSPAAS